MTTITATSITGTDVTTASIWAKVVALWNVRRKAPAIDTQGDEIGRFVAARGGVLTDTLEREIGRRFGV